MSNVGVRAVLLRKRRASSSPLTIFFGLTAMVRKRNAPDQSIGSIAGCDSASSQGSSDSEFDRSSEIASRSSRLTGSPSFSALPQHDSASSPAAEISQMRGVQLAKAQPGQPGEAKSAKTRLCKSYNASATSPAPSPP